MAEQKRSTPITPEVLCRRCKATIDVADNYCRQCGTPTGFAGNTRAAWWESPWVVLTLLFVVVGPFALPLLWRSRRFNRFWKVALSILVLGITVYVVWQVWYLFNRALAPLLEWDVSRRF